MKFEEYLTKNYQFDWSQDFQNITCNIKTLHIIDAYVKEMCRQQRIICSNRIPTMQVEGELYNMICRSITEADNPIDNPPKEMNRTYYCRCRNRSSFYRDKEDNDICYDCDLPITNNK